MQHLGRSIVWLVAAVAALGSACGEFLDIGGDQTFSNLFGDNRAEDVQRVAARIPPPVPEAGPQNRLGRPLVVGLKYGTPGIFVYDVSAGAMLWSRDMPVGSRPVVTDRSIVAQTGLEVASFDLADGSEMWRIDTEGLSFFGAGWDDQYVYLSLGVEAARIGRLLAVKSDTGGIAWKVQTNKLFGRPAAAGGLVFVPWDHQNVSVVDRESQDEIARIRTTDDVINFVTAGPRGVFYGSRGIYRFDANSYAGTKAGSTYYAPPMAPVPGEPELWSDGFSAPTGGRNAREKIRYYFLPAVDASGAGVALEHGAVYLLYFRFVIAYDALTGEILWTYRHRDDIEAMTVESSGVFLLDSAGGLTRLAPGSGLPDWSAVTGLDVAAAVFDIAGFAPPSSPVGTVAPMRTQLLEMILDQDNRLLPFRQYAVGVLAAMADPEVTRDILDVYAQRSSPQALKDTARAALAQRQGGAEFLVGALDTHTDYLMNTTAPPMGVVSQALASMGAREAVSGLVAHLLDPETPADDLQEVAQALVLLGDASLISTFESYLTLYHSDSAFGGNCNALNVLADGLLKYGGAPERAFLDALVADPHTVPALKAHVQQRYEEVVRAGLAADEAARLAAEAAAAAATGPVVEAEIPQSLSRDTINRTLVSNQATIAPCVQAQMARTPTLTQIRLVFKIVNTGSATDLQVLPDDPELKACLAEKIAGIQFPRFQVLSQRAQFTIDIRPPAPVGPPEPPPGTPPVGPPGPPTVGTATPPVGTPPIGTPPVGTPPIGTSPVGTPPVGTPPPPPVGVPPAGTPPAGTPPPPPVGVPPVGPPPAGTPPPPPVGVPPVGPPPVGTPPPPPVGVPPVGPPPVGTPPPPPVGVPPVGPPPVGAPPPPPVGVPPVGPPPVGTPPPPPVGAPPVGTPPVGTPPSSIEDYPDVLPPE